MYYKPMRDLPYISSEQGGGLIIRTKLIYKYSISVLYLYIYIYIQELRAEEGGGRIVHHGLMIRTIR